MEQVKLLMTELSPELTRLCAETLAAFGMPYGPYTGEAIRSEARGPWTEPEALAARVVEDLRRQGADAILKAVLG